MNNEKKLSHDMNEERILPHVAMSLVIVWLVLVFYAFWWFEYRQLQPFVLVIDNKAVFFDGELLMQRMAASLSGEAYAADFEPAVATVVHFWDPECPCNKFN